MRYIAIFPILIFFCVLSYTYVQKPYQLMQVKNTSDVGAINYNFDTLYGDYQSNVFTIVVSTPQATDGQNGNIKILNTVDSTVWIYVKANNKWYKTEVK